MLDFKVGDKIFIRVYHPYYYTVQLIDGDEVVVNINGVFTRIRMASIDMYRKIASDAGMPFVKGTQLPREDEDPTYDPDGPHEELYAEGSNT